MIDPYTRSDAIYRYTNARATPLGNKTGQLVMELTKPKKSTNPFLIFGLGVLATVVVLGVLGWRASNGL